MKVLFCGYREWALKIHTSLSFPCVLVSTPEELKEEVEVNTYDIIFFIGWSWFVEDHIISSSKCICLHPSPLPKYRGGSPLQNQIINGETISAITFFVMDEQLDHGKILWQEEFALAGSLPDIFERMVTLGTAGIEFILNHPQYEGYEQEHALATTYKRRKPKESEIKLEDLCVMTSKELYNKIRCLQDPYPRPFIRCKNGTTLYITGAQYAE